MRSLSFFLPGLELPWTSWIISLWAKHWPLGKSVCCLQKPLCSTSLKEAQNTFLLFCCCFWMALTNLLSSALAVNKSQSCTLNGSWNRDQHLKGRKGNKHFKAHVITNHEITIPENNQIVPQTPPHPGSLRSPGRSSDPPSTAFCWGLMALMMMMTVAAVSQCQVYSKHSVNFHSEFVTYSHSDHPSSACLSLWVSTLIIPLYREGK